MIPAGLGTDTLRGAAAAAAAAPPLQDTSDADPAWRNLGASGLGIRGCRVLRRTAEGRKDKALAGFRPKERREMPVSMEGLRALRGSKTFRYGLPMVVLAIAGSLGIRELTQIRLDVKKYQTQVDPALQEEYKRKKISLEEEYEKMQDKTFDDWKNIRGPRPWEDSKTVQELQRQQERE